MSDEIYKKAAYIITKAGILPTPVNSTLIEILKTQLTEDELDFINAFRRKTSQTMDQLKKTSKLSEPQILSFVKRLAKKGFIFNQPNSEGVMVYRLMPLLMVGAFEYLYMKKIEHNEVEEKLAKMFSNYFEETRDFIQANYEQILPIFENMLPIDRTVPILNETIQGDQISLSVNKEIEVPEETILLTQNVEELIEKFDDISVGHCFCRHHRDLLGNPCKYTDLRENCFTFGKSARYVAEQGFGRLISKGEALEIMKKSEDDGLVHKAFHPHSDITKTETSICNCCKDCCGTLEWWRMGIVALINSTNYLSQVDPDLCVGCGTCVEKCPVDAIELNDSEKAEVNAECCIGCGVCAHFCPENAISLLEGMRKVYVAPPRLR
ncbi:MAG: 4Fe-4S binding protein [Candidatus Lokiarchaeota archaeon]|nr:4Fe-4S binding protein [Candidatus Lokiarchaeota archaeon]